MRALLRWLLSDPPPEVDDASLEAIQLALDALERRVRELEGAEVVREASHQSRVDALSRLYKRVSQRFADSPDTNPSPRGEAAPTGTLELRRRLNR